MLVDGSWTGWHSWSRCSIVCGRESRTRTRSCTNPRTAYWGKPCDGINEERMKCKLQSKCTHDRPIIFIAMKIAVETIFLTLYSSK